MRCNKPMLTRRLISLRCVLGLVAILALAACGGGGGGGSHVPGLSDGSAAPSNVHPIAVSGGPNNNNVNLLLASVTICTPGSSTQCQTINDILVDTGSFGLRIMASALNGSAALSTVRNDAGVPLVECAQFADGFTWGPVRRADVRLADEVARNIPIQVIGDSTYPVVPTACQNTGNDNSSVGEFHANGVLGIGVFREDCGNGCTFANVGLYYACTGSACNPTTASLQNQVRNPVGDFASNNNGVIIELPAVPASGAVSVSGSMIFGIGTQSNNTLGNARVINVDPNYGYFTTSVPGQVFPDSFVDTGSNGLFFPTSSTAGAYLSSAALPTCNVAPAPEFFCPTSTSQLDFTATVQGYSNGNNVAVNFSIGNANNLLTANRNFVAYANIGAPVPSGFSSSFDWGLPFYFGRRVYTALEGASTPGGNGPYVAF